MSNLVNFKYEWIWKKTISSGSMNAKIMPLKQHESVLVFSGNSKKITYYPIMEKGTPYKTKAQKFTASNYGEQERPEIVNEGERYPTTIVEVSNPRIKGGHPTQKPVDLMKYFIETYTKEGDTVLDNCMGSGSTGIACVKTGRKFIGIELNKEYYDAAKKRLEQAEQKRIIEDSFLDF
jgi:DNA modification methylase